MLYIWSSPKLTCEGTSAMSTVRNKGSARILHKRRRHCTRLCKVLFLMSTALMDTQWKTVPSDDFNDDVSIIHATVPMNVSSVTPSLFLHTYSNSGVDESHLGPQVLLQQLACQDHLHVAIAVLRVISVALRQPSNGQESEVLHCKSPN